MFFRSSGLYHHLERCNFRKNKISRVFSFLASCNYWWFVFKCDCWAFPHLHIKRLVKFWVAKLSPCQLSIYERKANFARFFFSASSKMFLGAVFMVVGLRWSVDCLVGIGGVEQSFPTGSCKGTTFSKSVWDLRIVKPSFILSNYYSWHFQSSLRRTLITFFRLGRRKKAAIHAAN